MDISTSQGSCTEAKSSDFKDSGKAALQEYQTVLCNLVETLGIDFAQLKFSAPITDKVIEEHFSCLALTPEEEHRVNVMASYAANAVNKAYLSQPEEIRVALAAYTTFMMTIDDYCPYMIESVINFSSNMLRGERQSHALLQGMQMLLNKLRKYFGKYACQILCKDTIDFLSGTFLECRYNHIILPRGSIHFPDSLQFKVGNSEAFAHFIFNEWEFPESEYLEVYLPVITELRIFIDAVNDIASFYKEYFIGNEPFNYINNYAIVHGISVLDSLRIRADEIVNSAKISGEILKNYPMLLKSVIDFIGGYFYFHLTQGRYRLKDMGLPYNLQYCGSYEEDFHNSFSKRF